MTLNDAFADELKIGRVSWLKAAGSAVNERSCIPWLKLSFRQGPAGRTSPRGWFALVRSNSSTGTAKPCQPWMIGNMLGSQATPSTIHATQSEPEQVLATQIPEVSLDVFFQACKWPTLGCYEDRRWAQWAEHLKKLSKAVQIPCGSCSVERLKETTCDDWVAEMVVIGAWRSARQ